MQNMFCTQCGTKLDDSARFCISCGNPTLPEAAVPPHAAQVGAGQYIPHSSAAVPSKRLRKIVAEKKISGVCAGFAEYFDIDITLMRVIWVALLLLPPHIGVIAYIVCVFVLPKG